jgi:hypothetical protein
VIRPHSPRRTQGELLTIDQLTIFPRSGNRQKVQIPALPMLIRATPKWKHRSRDGFGIAE